MLGDHNRIRMRLGSGGGPALGIICRALSPAIVEIAGLAGFDFVWIDMEHTTADFSTVEHLCRAADAVGIDALVRVPDKQPSSVVRALDAGATIINVPQVEDRTDAEAAARAGRYYPRGERGFCSSSRGNRYGIGARPTGLFEAANERVLLMAQIESVRGVANAEAICSVPGIDVVFIGMGDLSQSLGVPAQFDHPELLASVERVLDCAKANGKIAAMQAETVSEASKWIDRGARLLAVGIDINVVGKSFLRMREEFGSLAVSPRRTA